ncbi:MAG: hypothetical protein RL410_1184 [Actinomycetota bacterium]
MSDIVQTSSDVVWPDWRNGKPRKARETILDSYVHQWYRFEIDGKLYELRPAENSQDPAKVCSPSEAHYFISAWNAHGLNQEIEELESYNVTLMTALEEAHYSYRQAVTVQRNLGWYEPSFLVKFPSDRIAQDWAWRYGQKAIVKWDAHNLLVLPAHRGSIKRHSSQWQLIEVHDRLCPVKRIKRDSECIPHGGPWTSSAINALVTWQEHRYLMISMLGCDVCADGSKTVGDKIKSTLESDFKTRLNMKMASRFGGYEQ